MTLAAYSDAVYAAVRAHVETNWTACPVRWPNEEFSPPDGPWVAFEINGSAYGQQTIGMDLQEDNRWDEDGHIWFHVMVPQGRGASQARGAAKALADLFRGQRLMVSQNLEFMDASIGPGRPGDDEGHWYAVSVSIEWRYWDA